MAKAFKFRLAPVLKYREVIEDEAKGRFAQITQLRNAKAQELDKLQSEEATAKGEMAKHKVGTIDTGSLRHLNRYISGLGMSQVRTAGELRVVDQEVERRRLEFVEARKNVRVMEKLKDKQREDHDYEVEQEQQRVFDEMALQRSRKDQLEEQARRAEEATPTETTAREGA